MTCTCARESGDNPCCPLHRPAPSGSDQGEGVVAELLRLSKRRYKHQPSIIEVLERQKPRGLRGHDWDNREAFEQAIAILKKLPELAVLSTPSSTLTRDADVEDVRQAFREAMEAPYRARGEDSPYSYELSETGSAYRSPHVQEAFQHFRAGFNAATPAIRDWAFKEAAIEAESVGNRAVAKLILALKGTSTGDKS